MNSSKTFRRFLQKPQNRVDCRELSPALAFSILEKENDLEKSASLPLIQELSNLYSKAIEHYEIQDNPKYLDFQEKLQKMLMKPQIYSILSSKSSNSLSAPSTETIFSQPAKGECLSPSPSSEHLRKSYSAQFTSSILSSPKNLIEFHSTASKVQSSNVLSVFKSQDLDLEIKKSARRLKKENRQVSFSFPETSEGFEDLNHLKKQKKSKAFSLFSSPKAGLSWVFEEYEKRLEKVMENNLAERAWKVLEARVKYEKEIENGKDVKMMRKSMEVEIQGILERYDSIRTEEILKIKKELF